MPGRALRLVASLSWSREFLLVLLYSETFRLHARRSGWPCAVNSFTAQMAGRWEHQEGAEWAVFSQEFREVRAHLIRMLERSSGSFRSLRLLLSMMEHSSPFPFPTPRPLLFTAPLSDCSNILATTAPFLSTEIDVWLLLFGKCVGEGRVHEMISFGSPRNSLGLGGKCVQAKRCPTTLPYLPFSLCLGRGAGLNGLHQLDLFFKKKEHFFFFKFE